MSTPKIAAPPASPQPGTAVAKAPAKGSMLERLLALAQTPEERERAFAIAERHQQNQVVMEMAAQLKVGSWGDRVSPMLRAEIIRWGLSAGADPVDEIDVLGGAPYLNARYWQRLVAAAHDFARPEEIWVHDDERADEDERAHRRELRVQYAIPDEIAATVGLHRDQKRAAEGKPPIKVRAAVVLLLHFTGRGPFIGKKWSPSRANDDVGLDHPEQSALTRAWRKAAMQAVRRKSPFTDKLQSLIVQGRVLAAAAGPEKLPEPVAGAEIVVEPLAPDASTPTEGKRTDLEHGGKNATKSEPQKAPAPRVGVIEKHEPNAICSVAGEHRREDCGHFRKAKSDA